MNTRADILSRKDQVNTKKKTTKISRCSKINYEKEDKLQK